MKTTSAKIVGSPTDNAWSQTYSAGNLYAVISLVKKGDADELSLNVAGKGILNNIEAEFFALEEKTLSNIKAAIASALTSTPDSIHVDLALCYIKDSAAYLFVVNKTRILLKRGEQIGTLVSGKEEKTHPRTVHAASGFLKNSDILVLETHAFSTHIPQKDVVAALDTPSLTDAEETLMPNIHAKEAGDAAVLFIQVKGDSGSPTLTEEPETDEETDDAPGDDKKEVIDAEERPEDPEKPEDEEEERTPSHSYTPPLQEVGERRKISLPTFSLPAIPQLSNRRSLFLILAVVLALTLGGSIYFVNASREQAKTSAAFQEVYDKALKDYEVGLSLEGLNQSVARDDFLKAQKTIQDNINKFKEGSTEREKLEELQAKIATKVGGEDAAQAVKAEAASDTASPLLGIQKATKASHATSVDGKYFYITKDAIIETDEDGDKKEELYENNKDWSDIAGLGAFGSNVYVLDRNEGVLKFVAGADGYGKQGYFKGDSPNLKNAADMTIDGSIYILLKNGEILKYTRGEKEAFTVSGLPQPLKNPTRIVTHEDSDNLYILDRGNSRIVALDKDGTFKNSYAAQVLRGASAITVDESVKKLYALSGNSLYEISL